MAIAVNDANIFIDLLEVDLIDTFFKLQLNLHTTNLHWFDFITLFNNLDDNNLIKKIMHYRSVDLKQYNNKHGKDQYKFYKKMKELYKLN